MLFQLLKLGLINLLINYLMNEWIREEFKFSKNGANRNRIASHFILFSLPSFCSFYCYDPNWLRSMRDFAPIPRFNWRIWHCSIQRTGRYVLESTLILLKNENNWSKWYWRAEWAVCGLSPRTPRCPSVTHKVEQVSTSCPSIVQLISTRAVCALSARTSRCPSVTQVADLRVRNPC